MTTDRIEARDPVDQNVFDLFRRQAEAFSDKIAVIAEDESVSYGELAARAESIGEYLAQRVKRDETIADRAF